MVVLTIKIDQRHGQLAQIHPFPVQAHFALNQQVVFIAVFNELAECFSRDVGTVENPAFHAHEVFHKIPVVHVFHEADIFINHQPRRIEQEKTKIHQIAGNIAERADHPIGVNILHPYMQKALVRVKTRRRNRGD